MSWLKKCIDWRNVFIKEMSALKKCLNWRNVFTEKMSWLKKCFDWRNVLVEQMSLWKKCLDQRNISTEELSWFKKCLDWRNVFIVEMSWLAKCLDWWNVLIKKTVSNKFVSHNSLSFFGQKFTAYFFKLELQSSSPLLSGRNPAMVLNSNKLFQIIHYCKTENLHHRKNFWWNLCLRTITDTFFPGIWSPIKRRMGWDMNKLLMPVSDTD